MTVLAIVGRPNVGKSTLFNRLVGGRPALVLDTPGVTRDRRYGELDYQGHHFEVIDTGGLDPEAERDAISAGIHRHAQRALDEADAVIFVVDAMTGPLPIDRELARRMRKTGRPLVVAVNKVDHATRDDRVGEFHALGLADVVGVSAAHGRGIDVLLETVIARLGLDAKPDADADADADAGSDGDVDADADAGRARAADRENAPLRVTFVGKPNAGKSSLMNRLIGSERSLVHDQPGTTTDPVDCAFEFRGKPYVLVDTAGIRRRARIEEATEKLSVTLALSQIERADVVVLVIDAAVGPSEQDARLAGLVEDAGRALVVALNKADLLAGAGAGKTVRRATDETLHFLTWAPVHLMSALRGDGMAELLGLVDKVAREHQKRVTTAELNRFFAEVCEHHPPPTQAGQTVTIHYLTQGGVEPPTFLLFANKPTHVSPAYRRFISNQLRARYGFRGTPIRVVVKAKSGERRERGPARRR